MSDLIPNMSLSSESSDSLSDWCLVEHEKQKDDDVNENASSASHQSWGNGGEEFEPGKKASVEEIFKEEAKKEDEEDVDEEDEGEEDEDEEDEESEEENVDLNCASSTSKDNGIDNSVIPVKRVGNFFEPSLHDYELLEKLVKGEGRAADEGIPVSGKPFDVEEMEGPNLHLTQHKKNSSSSDISIIDESMEPFIRDCVTNAVMESHYFPYALSAPGTKLSGLVRHDLVAAKRNSKRKHVKSKPQWFSDADDPTVFFQFLLCFAILGSLMFGVMYCLIVFCITRMVPYNPYNEMNQIHTSLLVCVGKQNLEAMESDKTELLLSPICLNESAEWNDVQQLLVRDKLRAALSQVQKLLYENETADLYHICYRDIKHIDVKLIIQHMEHYEVLPKLLSAKSHYKEATYKLQAADTEDLMTQMEQVVKNLSILNENLHNHVKLITLPQNISSLGAAEESIEGAKKNNSSLVNTLEEKVKVLVAQNEELKTEIHNLKRTPDTEDVLPNQKQAFVDSPSALKFNFQKMEMSSKETLNVAHQIHLLQNSFEEKFRKLLVVLQELKSEPNVSRSSSGEKPDGKQWSWNSVKADVKKFIREKRNSIKETVNNYKNINVAETLNDYVQGSKKHAENTLRLVTQFVKVAQKKTKEIIDEQISEIDVEKTVSGVWNMWGAIQNKWSDIKHRFDDLTGNISPNHASSKSNVEDRKPIVPTENESCSSKQSLNDLNEKDILNGNNWFLKRAALRENQRLIKLPLNWYLRREIYRERIRKLHDKEKCLRCEF